MPLFNNRFALVALSTVALVFASCSRPAGQVSAPKTNAEVKSTATMMSLDDINRLVSSLPTQNCQLTDDQASFVNVTVRWVVASSDEYVVVSSADPQTSIVSSVSVQKESTVPSTTQVAGKITCPTTETFVALDQTAFNSFKSSATKLGAVTVAASTEPIQPQFPCTVTQTSTNWNAPYAVVPTFTLSNRVLNQHPAQTVKVLANNSTGSFKNPHLQIVAPSGTDDNGILDVKYGVVFPYWEYLDRLNANYNNGTNTAIPGFEWSGAMGVAKRIPLHLNPVSIANDAVDSWDIPVTYAVSCANDQTFFGKTGFYNLNSFRYAIENVESYYYARNNYVAMVPFVPETATQDMYIYNSSTGTGAWETRTVSTLKTDQNAPLAQLFPGVKIMPDPNVAYDSGFINSLDNMGASLASGVGNQNVTATEVPVFFY